MEFLVVIWVIFCVVVAVLASGRGRSGIGWFLLAVVISPLLAFLILAFVPDLSKAKAARDKRERDKLKISGADLLLSFDKLRQLHDRKMLSDIEYIAKKMKLIDGLQDRYFEESPENFLASLIPLLDAKILSQEEIEKIKAIVFAQDNDQVEDTEEPVEEAVPAQEQDPRPGEHPPLFNMGGRKIVK